MKILMVCLGNICRSPMAEGIMRHKIKQNNLLWEVDSAGTAAYHAGEAPDSRAQNELKKYQIDISKQQAKKFSPYLFEKYDLIFAMDASIYQDIIRQTNSDEEKNKVELIMNISEPDRNISIPDPYYDDKLYEVVYNMLNNACDAIIKKYSIENLNEKK